MTLFSEKVLVKCISGLIPNLIKKSWTNSNAAAALAFADMYCCAFSNILTDLQRTIKEYVVNFKSQSPISNQFVENHG